MRSGAAPSGPPVEWAVVGDTEGMCPVVVSDIVGGFAAAGRDCCIVQIASRGIRIADPVVATATQITLGDVLRNDAPRADNPTPPGVATARASPPEAFGRGSINIMQTDRVCGVFPDRRVPDLRAHLAERYDIVVYALGDVDEPASRALWRAADTRFAVKPTHPTGWTSVRSILQNLNAHSSDVDFTIGATPPGGARIGEEAVGDTTPVTPIDQSTLAGTLPDYHDDPSGVAAVVSELVAVFTRQHNGSTVCADDLPSTPYVVAADTVNTALPPAGDGGHHRRHADERQTAPSIGSPEWGENDDDGFSLGFGIF